MGHDAALTGFAFPFVHDYDVRDSSFFRAGRELPTPDEVRTRRELYRFNDMRKDRMLLRPPLVRFQNLDLAVKFGSHVSIAEAHCLLFLRAHAPAVPVPELFGWRQDRRQTFLYMKIVHGHTACQLLSLSHASLNEQVQAVVNALRQIPQSLVSPVPFVGHVNGTHLRDWSFVNSATPLASAGPFPSVAAFHDWLAYEHGRPPGSDLSMELHSQFRSQLPDGAAIALVHGGLTLNNLMVSQPQADGTVTLLAVVDWSQAGWYPAYWEGLRRHEEVVGEEGAKAVDACDYFLINAST